MTRRVSRLLDVVAVVLGLALGWHLGPVVEAYLWPRPHVPTMNRVDQPRCFPEGTEGTAGFPMCPDSLPTQRRA